MSHTSQNLGMTVLHEGEPADLMTVSDNFDAIDAVVGDIATVESSPTASSHAVGEFLLYEGRLYKVTSAISVGGSLILGTNVAAANIGTELKSLQDSLGWVVQLFTTGEMSFAANESKHVQIPITIPSGYTPVGLIGFGTNLSTVIPYNGYVSGTNASLNVKNITNSIQTSDRLFAYVLFMKTM